MFCIALPHKIILAFVLWQNGTEVNLWDDIRCLYYFISTSRRPQHVFTWLTCSTARPKCPHQAQRAGSQPPRSTDPQVLIFMELKPWILSVSKWSAAPGIRKEHPALEEQGTKTRWFMLEFCALDDGQEHIPEMRAPDLIKQVTVRVVLHPAAMRKPVIWRGWKVSEDFS